MPAPEPRDALWQELQPLLDQELNRLPDKYRFVVVACDLEGRPRREVAAMLDVPEGTVASRLSRGRDLLAKRLRRHAFTVSPALLAILLARHAEAVVVPPHLIQAATGGLADARAAALADSVVRGLSFARTKLVVAVTLIVAILCVGVAALLPVALAERHDLGKPASIPGTVKREKPVMLRDCIIQSIDWTNRVIRVVTLCDTGEAAPIDVKIDEDVVVIIDGERRGFAELQPGMSVSLDIHRQKGEIDRGIRIESAGSWSPGFVSSINGESITVRIVDKQDQGEKTYRLDPKLWLFVDGKKAKAGEIKAKMAVEIQSLPKKNGMQIIKAVGPKTVGELKKIDVKAGKLSIGAESHRLADEFSVVRDGRHAKLTDVPIGSRVVVQFSAADGRVVSVATLRE